jgi:hypothetical protein
MSNEMRYAAPYDQDNSSSEGAKKRKRQNSNGYDKFTWATENDSFYTSHGEDAAASEGESEEKKNKKNDRACSVRGCITDTQKPAA